MQCIIFVGRTFQSTQNRYNEWAKGKSLARDVIIHTNIFASGDVPDGLISITVFFDEVIHKDWAKKEMLDCDI